MHYHHFQTNQVLNFSKHNFMFYEALPMPYGTNSRA